MHKKDKTDLLKLSEYYKIHALPSISVDPVIFGFHNNTLYVILMRLKNSSAWGIPGGYILKNENLSDACDRILQERTGVTNVYMTQFEAFGELNRSEAQFSDFSDDVWHKQRYITIAYYALINYEDVTPANDMYSAECKWVAIDELPELMMDHGHILEKAIAQLRRDLNYKPVGLNLLPEKFTYTELRKLYEVILGKELNRGNFYRKMKRYDILTKLDEKITGGAHKAPDLYSFNHEKYLEALKNGFQEIW